MQPTSETGIRRGQRPTTYPVSSCAQICSILSFRSRVYCRLPAAIVALLFLNRERLSHGADINDNDHGGFVAIVAAVMPLVYQFD